MRLLVMHFWLELLVWERIKVPNIFELEVDSRDFCSEAELSPHFDKV